MILIDHSLSHDSWRGDVLAPGGNENFIAGIVPLYCTYLLQYSPGRETFDLFVESFVLSDDENASLHPSPAEEDEHLDRCES